MHSSRQRALMMGPAEIVDRLAAVDQQLTRAEALRALAQTDGNDAEVQRLQQEIDELRKVKAELREQLRLRGGTWKGGTTN
jgi:hypothetical protein